MQFYRRPTSDPNAPGTPANKRFIAAANISGGLAAENAWPA
jgi:hypothetical protein